MSEERFNSATRLSRLLRRAASESADVPAFQIWARLLGIDAVEGTQLAPMMMDRMKWILDEVSTLHRESADAGMQEDIIGEVFPKIRRIIDPLRMSAGWPEFRNAISPDVTMFLRMASQMIPAGEIEIPGDQIRDLLAALVEFEESLAAGDLDQALVSFMRHRIEDIRSALDRYPIAGARALKECVEGSLGALQVLKRTGKPADLNLNSASPIRRVYDLLTTMVDYALRLQGAAALSAAIAPELLGLAGG